MLYVINEKEFKDSLWGKKKNIALALELKKKRIKYREVEKPEELYDIALDDDMPVVVVIGASESWFNHIVSQCSMMNIRVIVAGDVTENMLGSNCSSVISDVKSSALDLYKYFTSYNKENVLLYSVNSASQFDMDLKKHVIDIFPDGKVDVMENDGDDDALREKFFENYRKYDAIVCTNDYSAIHLLNEIKRRDIAYLNNVFLVSFSNSLLARLYSPSITTFYESSTGVDYIVKIYELLTKNRNLSNIKFSVREYIKIRQTTQFCPYYYQTIENSVKTDESLSACLPEVKTAQSNTNDTSKSVLQLYDIENLLSGFDKTDYNILILLMMGKSSLEMERMLYVSRGSIRYRINRMTEQLKLKSKYEMADLFKQFIDVNELLLFTEEQFGTNGQ